MIDLIVLHLEKEQPGTERILEPSLHGESGAGKM